MPRLPRTVRPYGPTALLLDWEARIDPAISAGVHAYAAAVATLAGVHECVPAYASLLVRFDPDRTTGYALREAIYDLRPDSVAGPPGTLHRLPVRYGGSEGPDLAEVADALGLPPRRIVELHTSRDYRVYQLGYRPGFAFLGATPPGLDIPRRAEARPRLPAGSVGLAGRQTGVYPTPGPGGWRIIGHCPTPLLLAQPPYVLLRPGDRVRFYAIDRWKN